MVRAPAGHWLPEQPGVWPDSSQATFAPAAVGRDSLMC